MENGDGQQNERTKFQMKKKAHRVRRKKKTIKETEEEKKKSGSTARTKLDSQCTFTESETEKENTPCARFKCGVCIKVENKRNEKSIFIKGKKHKKKKHYTGEPKRQSDNGNDNNNNSNGTIIHGKLVGMIRQKQIHRERACVCVFWSRQ